MFSRPAGIYLNCFETVEFKRAVAFGLTSSLQDCIDMLLDNFSVRKCLESSAAWAVESLFKLLGIHFAESGKKAAAFTQRFKMLGLVSRWAGTVQIGHTEKRRAELCAFIDGILDAGSLNQKTFKRLCGRVVFKSFAFGRVSSLSVASHPSMDPFQGCASLPEGL